MATNPLIQRPVIDPSLPPAGNPLATPQVNIAPVDPLARQAAMVEPAVSIPVNMQQVQFLGGHSAPALDPIAVANAQLASQQDMYQQALLQREQEAAALAEMQERMRQSFESLSAPATTEQKDTRFSGVSGGVEVAENKGGRPADWQEGDDEVLILPEGKSIMRYEMRKIQEEGGSGFADRFGDAQGWAPWKAGALSDAYSVGGIIAGALGSEKLARKWLEEGVRWTNESMKYASENDDIGNAIANGKTFGWLGNVSGQLANTLAEIGGTAAAGALAGSVGGAVVGAPFAGVGAAPGAAAGGGGGAIAGAALGTLRVVARKLLGKSLGEAARQTYQRKYAQELLRGVTEEAARKSADRAMASTIGASVGRNLALVSNSAVRGTGETVRAAQEANVDPLELSYTRLAAGVGAYTAADFVGDRLLLGGMRNILKPAGPATGGLVRNVAVGGAAEGGTEVVQGIATNLAGAGELPTGAETVNSFLAGFLGGGALRGVSSLRSAGQKQDDDEDGSGDQDVPQTPPAVDPLADSPQADQTPDAAGDQTGISAVVEQDNSPAISVETFDGTPTEYAYFVARVDENIGRLNTALQEAGLRVVDPETSELTAIPLAVDREGFFASPDSVLTELRETINVARRGAQDSAKLVALDRAEDELANLNSRRDDALLASEISAARENFIRLSPYVDGTTTEDALVRNARSMADVNGGEAQRAAAIWLELQGGRNEHADMLTAKAREAINLLPGGRDLGIPAAVNLDTTLRVLDNIAAGLLTNGVIPGVEMRQAAARAANTLRTEAAQALANNDIRASDYQLRAPAITEDVAQADRAINSVRDSVSALRAEVSNMEAGDTKDAANTVLDVLQNVVQTDDILAQNGENVSERVRVYAEAHDDVLALTDFNTLKAVSPQGELLQQRFAELSGLNATLNAYLGGEHTNTPLARLSQPTRPQSATEAAQAQLTNALQAAERQSQPAAYPLVSQRNQQVDMEVGPLGEPQPGASWEPRPAASRVEGNPSVSQSVASSTISLDEPNSKNVTPKSSRTSGDKPSQRQSQQKAPTSSKGNRSTNSGGNSASPRTTSSASRIYESSMRVAGRSPERGRVGDAVEQDDDTFNPSDLLTDEQYQNARKVLHNKHATAEDAIAAQLALEKHRAAKKRALGNHYVDSRRDGDSEYIVVANSDPETGEYSITEKDGRGNVTWRATASDPVEARTMLVDRGYAARRVTKGGPAIELQPLSSFYRAGPVTRSIVTGIRKALGIEVDDPAMRPWEDALVRFTESMGFHFSNFYNTLEGYDRATRASTNQDGQIALRFKNGLMRANAIGLRDPHAAGAYSAIALRLKEINATQAELGRYLHALTALERHERHSGTTISGTLKEKGDVTHFEHNGKRGIDAVRDYLNDLPPSRRQQLESASKPLRDLQQFALQRAVQSELMTFEEAQQLGLRRADGTLVDGAYEHYVPLLSEKGRGKRMHWVTGRARPEGSSVANPLLMALDASTTLLKRAEHNESLAVLASTLRQFNDPREFTLDVSEHQPKYKPEQFMEEHAEDLVGLNDAQKAAVEIRWFDPDARKEDSLTFRQGGKLHSITFHSDAGKRMVKRMHTAPNVWATRIASAMHLISGTITLMPSFQAKAAAWDGLMVLGKIQSASGNTITNEEARRMTARMYYYYVGSVGALGKNALTHKKSDNAWTRFYDETGAGVAPGSRGGFEQAAANMRRAQFEVDSTEATSARERLGNVLTNNYNRFVDTSHAVESGFRLAAMRAYIEDKAGRKFDSIEDIRKWAQQNPYEYNVAIQISRDITTDYSTHGANAWVRALYLFFNPAVRGAKGARDMLYTAHGRRLFFAMIGMGLVAGMIGTGVEDEDDDGRSRYLHLSQRDAQIQFGEGFGIPLAHELRLPYVFGREIATLGSGDSSLIRSIESLINAAVGIASPIQWEADDSSEKALMAMLPYIAQGAVTAGFGIDRFGKSLEVDEHTAYGINPETGENMGKVKDPADHMLARPNTPLWARRLAAATYDTTGGSVDVSPARLSEMARWVSGGLLNAGLSVTDPNRPIRQLLTSGFENKYQLFELKSDFEDTRKELNQRRTQFMRTGDDLRYSDAEKRDLGLIMDAEDYAKKLVFHGKNESQWYEELRKAQASGDTEAEVFAYNNIQTIRMMKNRVYGQTLLQLSRRYVDE